MRKQFSSLQTWWWVVVSTRDARVPGKKNMERKQKSVIHPILVVEYQLIVLLADLLVLAKWVIYSPPTQD